jgi:hypothetical protein
MPILNNWGGAGSNFKSNNAYDDYKPLGIGPSETTNIKLRGGGHGEVINPALGFMGAKKVSAVKTRQSPISNQSLNRLETIDSILSAFQRAQKDNSNLPQNLPKEAPAPASGPNLLSVLKENNQSLIDAINDLSNSLIAISMADANKHKVDIPGNKPDNTPSSNSDLSEISKIFSRFFELILAALKRENILKLNEKSFDIDVKLGDVNVNSKVDINFKAFFEKINEFIFKLNDIASREISVKNTLENNINLDIKKPIDINLLSIPAMLGELLETTLSARKAWLESLEYQKAAKEIKDLDGVVVAKTSPREIKAIKDATQARGNTDENNFELDETELKALDIDGDDDENLMSLFFPESRLDIQKKFIQELKKSSQGNTNDQ